MVPSYALDNASETERLEEQSRLPGYSLDEELRFLRLDPGQLVLDAGTGSGVVARELHRRFPWAKIQACDFSDLRLRQASALCTEEERSEIRFFRGELESIPRADGTYDAVVCRYVFEHLVDPLQVARELRRVLKPGGRVYLVNFDGIVLNLGTRDPELNAALESLRRVLPFDLCIGRRLPALLAEAGFGSIEWTADLVQFQGAELQAEIRQMRQRFGFAEPVVAQALGSPEAARGFIDAYCAEMAKPETALFYTKFLVRARRA